MTCIYSQVKSRAIPILDRTPKSLLMKIYNAYIPLLLVACESKLQTKKIFLYSFDPGLSIGEGIMFSAQKLIFG